MPELSVTATAGAAAAADFPSPPIRRLPLSLSAPRCRCTTGSSTTRPAASALRRAFCHSAAPPSASSRRFDTDGEGVEGARKMTERSLASTPCRRRPPLRADARDDLRPDGHQPLAGTGETPRPAVAVPMENPYCSCKRVATRPTPQVMAYSCNPYGEPLLQLYADTCSAVGIMTNRGSSLSSSNRSGSSPPFAAAFCRVFHCVTAAFHRCSPTAFRCLSPPFTAVPRRAGAPKAGDGRLGHGGVPGRAVQQHSLWRTPTAAVS